MKLTDTECRKAQPKEKRYRLSDKNGLSLLVTLLGQKYWNIHFTVLGERKSESLGPYPDMSLKKARELALELKYKYSKSVLHDDIKPFFKEVAEDWFENQRETWSSKHISNVRASLDELFIALANFISYKADEKEQLITAFCAELQKVQLSMDKSAILCRSRTHVNELAGRNIEAGQGIVKIFVEATILRDRAYDYNKAFNKIVRCLISLLDNPPENFMAMIIKSNGDSEMSELRRVIWEFVRNPIDGLPSAELVANKCWHSKLKNNVEKLLETLECNFGLIPVKNLGGKLANKSLPNTPLIPESDLVNKLRSVIRIDTVHQAKGESLDAVLYLATEKSHIQNLLNGTDTEIGRIGYVAITRAKELLWLGVPENCIAKFREELINKGFIEVGRN